MPKISLVVCLKGERDLLARLLEKSEGCFDDLVVVHDGPEDLRPAGSRLDDLIQKEPGWRSPEHVSLIKPKAPPEAIARDYYQISYTTQLPSGYRLVNCTTVVGSIHELVARHGGRFYEGPRCFQQEPHWPFAWWVARHDWILRLDADEIPSADMQMWLKNFRNQPSSGERFAGYSCIWPLWDGRRATTSRWPRGRLFLFNKQHARFFGLTEQTPIIEGEIIETGLVLRHEPARKSYGIRNILFRRQAYFWRRLIAECLLKTPLDLPRWRWLNKEWPMGWHKLLEAAPLEGIYRLCKFPAEQAICMRAVGEKISPSACLNPALHHALLAWTLWRKQSFRPPVRALRAAIKKRVMAAVFRCIKASSGPLKTLGTICPWTLDISKLHKNSKVISGGVGGDISFELELLSRTGCTIALFDPSPTGQATIERLQPLPEGLTYFAVGLSGKSGSEKFAPPFDQREGSFRKPNSREARDKEWRSVAVVDILREQGWDGLDLIKLDIEGFEFDVLNSVLKEGIQCPQILVEFHYGKGFPNSFWKYIFIIFRIWKAGYRLVSLDKADHTFCHHSALR